MTHTPGLADFSSISEVQFEGDTLVWEGLYRAYLHACAEKLSTRAELGHRMKSEAKRSLGNRWRDSWPYKGGRSKLDVPSGTITGWMDRGSLPTIRDNLQSTLLIRRLLVDVVTETVLAVPPLIATLASEAGVTPPSFREIVSRLAEMRAAAEAAFRSSEVEQASDRTCRMLSRLSPGYPDHLSVSALASEIHVSRIENSEDFTDSEGLYMPRRYRGPESIGLDAIQTTRISVILGNPGGGKSTLLAAHCISHLKRRQQALFLRLDDLGRIAEDMMDRKGKNTLTLREVCDCVIDAWDNWRAESSSSALRAAVSNDILNTPDSLIGLDGLDEVTFSESRMGAVREVLRELANSTRTNLVVTSRFTGYIRPIDNAIEYAVEPLTPKATRRFIDSWFSKENAGDPGRTSALQALQNQDIQNLVSTPVIVGILCYVAEGGSVETTKFGLYRQYLNRYLRRTWRPKNEQRSTPSEIDSARTAAQELARAMSGLDNRSLTGQWLDTASLNWLRIKTNASVESTIELFQRDGLLIAFGRPADTDPLSQRVRWLHRTLHEHLSGRALAEIIVRSPQSGEDLLAQVATLPEWREPLSHTAGALSELGGLEGSADRLWGRDHSDPAVRSAYERASVRALVEGKSSHRHLDVVTSLIDRGEWLLLEELAPDELRSHIRSMLGTDDQFNVWSMLQTFSSLDGLEWNDVLQLESSEVDQRDSAFFSATAAWKVDPSKAFEYAIAKANSGVFTPFALWPGVALQSAQLAILDLMICERLRNKDFRLLEASFQIQHSYPEELAKGIAEAKLCLSSTLYNELLQARVLGRSATFSGVAKQDLRLALGNFSHDLSFELGWSLSENGVPLPARANRWAAIGHTMAQNDWSDMAEIRNAFASIAQLDPTFPAHWSDKPR